jgi:RNA polymerase sigma-70 factor (ECF subfamily)
MQIRKNLYGPNEVIDEAINELSFETVIHENEAKIINLIFGMTGDYHVAQDLAQETFLKAFIKILAPL